MQTSFIFKKVLTPVFFFAVASSAQADDHRKRAAPLEHFNACSFAMDSNAVDLSASLRAGRPLSEYEALTLLHRFFESTTIEGIHLANGKSLLFPDMNKKCTLVGNQNNDNSGGMFTLFLNHDDVTESLQLSLSEYTDIRILRFRPSRVLQFQATARGNGQSVVALQFERLPDRTLQIDFRAGPTVKTQTRHIKCVFN